MTEKKAPVRVEQRTISGRGVFQIPPSKLIRRLYLYLNVVRLPHVNFTSSKFNPDRSEYCKITWSRNDYIIREDVMHFEHTLHTWDQDPVGYASYAHVCMYNAIIAYFDYLAPAVGLPPLTRTGFIYMEPMQDLPDKIRIVCRDDTAIIADLWKYEYDIACTEADSESPPPPDPPQPSKVPVDYPIGDISPPYSEPNDDGDTVPYPSDESAPPPPDGQGEPCAIITVNFEYDLLSGGTVVNSTQVYAPYYSIRIARDGVVGVNYTESIRVTAARQSTEFCANGETEEISAGYSSVEPYASEVRFLGIS